MIRLILIFLTAWPLSLGAGWGCSSPADGSSATRATPAAPPALAAPDSSLMAEGAALYQAHCLACHMAGGGGVPGLNPPVRDTDWVTGDPDRLIRVILFGLNEPLEIGGDLYRNEMPGYPHLSDAEIATLLTYIRRSFGNQAPAIAPEAVAALRP